MKEKDVRMQGVRVSDAARASPRPTTRRRWRRRRRPRRRPSRAAPREGANAGPQAAVCSGCSTDRGAPCARETDGAGGVVRVVRVWCVCRSCEEETNKHRRSLGTRALSRLFFSLAVTRNRAFRFALFRARFVADRITRCSRAPWRGGSAVSHARAGLDSPTPRRDSHHVRPRLGCVSRFDARVSRITARRDAPRAATRNAARAACRRRQLRFSRAFEVRVAGRARAAAGPSSRRRASP